MKRRLAWETIRSELTTDYAVVNYRKLIRPTDFAVVNYGKLIRPTDYAVVNYRKLIRPTDYAVVNYRKLIRPTDFAVVNYRKLIRPWLSVKARPHCLQCCVLHVACDIVEDNKSHSKISRSKKSSKVEKVEHFQLISKCRKE
jgi:hypothetical protein